MKKSLIIIAVVIIIIAITSGSFYYVSYKRRKEEKKIEDKINSIKKHYSEKVITSDKCNIYTNKDNKFKKFGIVEKEEIFELNKISINKDTKYFPIKDSDLYLDYKCIKKTTNIKEVNRRYKKYVLFNENVITKESVKLYRGDKLVYSINISLDLPIIIKDDDSYGIEYFNEMFDIKKEDVLKTYENNNTVLEKDTSIPVIAYHFIYKEDDYSCNDIICHSVNQIDEHFKYLKENNYFTINTKEMEYFLDKKINLPKNSILITIDDGDRVENVIPILEKYEVNATAFLISAWYGPNNYKSKYLELASHTNEMHSGGFCSGGQGSALKCLPKEKIVEDLKLSRKTLNNTEAFCYPLYEYNKHAIDAVIEAGFKIGFVGGQKQASINSNKYTVPRITLFRDTTVNDLIKSIK